MEYDASHKASSVTSISSSSSSWDPLPSLYTGRADSVSSAYELDDLQEPEPFESAPGFNYTTTKEPIALNIAHDGEKTFSEFLNSFFKPDNTLIIKKEEKEVIDHEVSPPATTLATTTPTKAKNSNSNKRSIEEVELLTEDQKRANHIASEQKRRNTIRGGFKELTEIIPTLKNINNSKSTILFKSVDYIKQLDKRNKSLKDKLLSLQQRLQARQQKKQMKSTSTSFFNHKHQQKQLELLQQQLRVQQALLTKHNIPLLYNTAGYHSSISIPMMDSTPTSPTLSHTSLSNNNVHNTHQQQHLYHSHKNNNNTTPITALVMPADEYPSFNIPADDEHDTPSSSSFRERLLSSGKLNHLRKNSSFML